MTRDRRLRLFIDVGTNCEIALGSAERLVCTAAPAGPAFEAAQIRCGMRAADGAIEVVRIGDDALEPRSSGSSSPASAARASSTARRSSSASASSTRRPLAPGERAADRPRASRRFVEREGGERVFVLHWKGTEGDVENAVYLSQRDVRELQFAKAAIATGWKLLVGELCIAESEIQQVLLAGSFGSYLPPASAVRIGLAAPAALGIVSAAVMAGEGAKMALLSMQERHAADAMFEEVEYVELSDRADFNDRFIEQLAFPRRRDRLRARPRPRLRRACPRGARGRAPERLDACRRARLPAALHLTPALIAPAVDARLRTWTARTSTSSSPTATAARTGRSTTCSQPTVPSGSRAPPLRLLRRRRRLGGAARRSRGRST